MQVFISSTYKDLIEERQHAVQAILSADHIPAGMELFKAGDEDQLTVIKKWIDDSDIYLLILGGRYGTLDPNSGLSYTHLEFNMAIESGIPLFVLVLSDDMLLRKKLATSNPQMRDEDIYETKPKNKKLHKEFLKHVSGNKRIVKFIDNVDQLKTEILSSLMHISKTKKLSGWVRATDNELIIENIELQRKVTALEEELNSLKKEPDDYFSEIEAYLPPSPTVENIGGRSLKEIIEELRGDKIFAHIPYHVYMNIGLKNSNTTALELFVNPTIRAILTNGIDATLNEHDELTWLIIDELIPVLRRLELIDTHLLDDAFTISLYLLNTNGHFVLGKIIR